MKESFVRRAQTGRDSVVAGLLQERISYLCRSHDPWVHLLTQPHVSRSSSKNIFTDFDGDLTSTGASCQAFNFSRRVAFSSFNCRISSFCFCSSFRQASSWFFKSAASPPSIVFAVEGNGTALGADVGKTTLLTMFWCPPSSVLTRKTLMILPLPPPCPGNPDSAVAAGLIVSCFPRPLLAMMPFNLPPLAEIERKCLSWASNVRIYGFCLLPSIHRHLFLNDLRTTEILRGF